MGKKGDPNYWQNTESTQSWTPYGQQGNVFNSIWNKAADVSMNPPGYFPGSTVAGQSAGSMQAGQAGLGLIGRAGQGMDDQYVNSVLQGDYLSPDSNPYLRQMAEQGAQDITRQFKGAVYPGTSLSAYGRGGSGAELNREAVAFRGLGDALASNNTNIFGRNYQMERGFQQQAVGLQAGLDQGSRADIMTGAQTGQYQDMYNQRFVDADVNRFNYNENQEGRSLDEYIRRVMGTGVLQGTTTSTENVKGRGPIQDRRMTPGQIAGTVLGAGSLGVDLYNSSRSVKNQLALVDPVECLNRLKHLPIAIWRYKEEFKPDDQSPHMGPYAEDMKQILNLGDGKTISFIDILGFALAATQGAAERVNVMEQRLEDLERMLSLKEAS